MKIIIGSDHAGRELREKVISYLNNTTYEVVDLGSDKDKSNYAVEGIKVAENIATNNGDFGIVICGSGIGISIAANKVKGIRCALCHSEEYAMMSRQHNNANVLALGGRYIEEDLAIKIIEKFLTTEFEGGRHEDRVDTLSDYELSCSDC